MCFTKALEVATLAQTPTSATTSDGKRKRPLILTFVVLLLFTRTFPLAAILATILYALMVGEGSGTLQVITEVLLSALILGLIILLIVAAIGLWLLRPMAWALNMIVMGFLLIIGLWFHFSEQSDLTNDAGLLLNVLIVFYLVQPEVRALFVSRPVDA
jgi:hypothetical protein